jgi:hypothetical protein
MNNGPRLSVCAILAVGLLLALAVTAGIAPAAPQRRSEHAHKATR